MKGKGQCNAENQNVNQVIVKNEDLNFFNFNFAFRET